MVMPTPVGRGWRSGPEGGTVWIITNMQLSISTPFTGIKDSGMGIEKGRLGILQYKQQHLLGLERRAVAVGKLRKRI